MKRKLLFCAILFFLTLLFGMACCSSEKARCWTIQISAFGLTEERLFWGTAAEVAAEAQTLRDASENAGVQATIYFEPSDYIRSSCK